MIRVGDQPLDTAFNNGYPADSIERAVLGRLTESGERHNYDTLNELKFELRLRREIVAAARALHASDLDFEVFRKSRCNPAYWRRQGDGGFQLKQGASASSAIRDIYEHGSRYGTECATAMQIVYCGALLAVFPEADFDRLFRNLVLMDWHNLNPLLRETGRMNHVSAFLPGDRRYFSNPEVDPETPEWQGENVIDLGDGTYYGHGLGIRRPAFIISMLNKNRRPGADREAYLLDSAGRPDFGKLFDLYKPADDAAAVPQPRPA